MKQFWIKRLRFVVVSVLLVCAHAHAGVVAERCDLDVSPEILEGKGDSELGALLPETGIWVCLRDGEMIGAVPELGAKAGESGSEVSTNALLELDCETRRNYSDSRIAALGRWHGFVNRKLWIVGGGRGDLPGRIRDKCVQMKPVSCEHRLLAAKSDAPTSPGGIPPFVTAVVSELGRLGERSMIVRAGRKKLLRALGSDDELVFSDGVFEDGERLVLEYAVLVSDCKCDSELACCWQLCESGGRILAAGTWRGKDAELDAQQRISMKSDGSGGRSFVFRSGRFGAEMSFSMELIAAASF